MRRLRGYVVKLPDGTRSPRTLTPVGLMACIQSDTDSPDGAYVCPVFAVPKRKLDEPTVWGFELRNDIGRTLVHTYSSWAIAERHSAACNGGPVFPLYVHPPTDAHKAAIAKAREEGRQGALADVRSRVGRSATIMRDDALNAPGSTDALRARQLGKVDGLLMAIGDIEITQGFGR